MEILLVDDEFYVTQSLAQTMPWHAMGINTVHQASSAMEALQILDEHDIDIIISDIKMPVMTGLQLIDIVGEKWPDIRSILLTGYSDFGYAKRAIKLNAFDYLLKPVDDEELIKCVSKAVDSLREEWAEEDKYHQLLHSRRSDLPVLRANLLHDLLLGKSLSHDMIEEKMRQYDIHLKVETCSIMLLVRLGKHFTEMDDESIALMEFAVGNIAEEVFSEAFHLWYSKTPHDYLIIIAQAKHDFNKKKQDLLESHVRILQQEVSNYLKGDISIVASSLFNFPDGLPASYRSTLSHIYLLDGHVESIVFIEEKEQSYWSDQAVKVIWELYKPPTLIHLLESRQWDAAEHKVKQVFVELEKTRFTREHLYEVFLSISNSYMYIAHKQGHYIYEIDDYIMDFAFDQSRIHSLDKLRTWALTTLEKLQLQLSDNNASTQSYIIKQVQELVSNDLGENTSVKTIAERVFLHPVYLSKVYKAETGESLSDYISRMRLERAVYLLRHTNKKIYTISAELGYQNPQYFSKVFKKQYGLTPNEFREQ